MSEEFSNLSVAEIEALINRAKQEIERRKQAGRENLRSEIEAKLASAGLDLSELFPEATNAVRKPRKVKASDGGSVVLPKFKDHVSGETWSGRGARPPQWVKSIMSRRGWTLEQFKQSDEFLAQN
jgi:DNA-binding protein H-NS